MFKKRNDLTAAIENRHWCIWAFKDINTDIKSCRCYKRVTEASLEGSSLLSEEGAVVQRILLLLQQGLFFEYYESNKDNPINPASYVFF